MLSATSPLSSVTTLCPKSESGSSPHLCGSSSPHREVAALFLLTVGPPISIAAYSEARFDVWGAHHDPSWRRRLRGHSPRPHPGPLHLQGHHPQPHHLALLCRPLLHGGQNLLILVHKLGHYIQLGTTIDDTIGEAYDKTVRWLGLDMGKGSGPALEEHALEGDPSSINFSVSFLKYSQILMNHESNTLKAESLLEISKSSLDEKGDRLKDKQDSMEQKNSLISSNADTKTRSKMPGVP